MVHHTRHWEKSVYLVRCIRSFVSVGYELEKAATMTRPSAENECHRNPRILRMHYNDIILKDVRPCRTVVPRDVVYGLDLRTYTLSLLGLLAVPILQQSPCYLHETLRVVGKSLVLFFVRL